MFSIFALLTEVEEALIKWIAIISGSRLLTTSWFLVFDLPKYEIVSLGKQPGATAKTVRRAFQIFVGMEVRIVTCCNCLIFVEFLKYVYFRPFHLSFISIEFCLYTMSYVYIYIYIYTTYRYLYLYRSFHPQKDRTPPEGAPRANTGKRPGALLRPPGAGPAPLGHEPWADSRK